MSRSALSEVGLSRSTVTSVVEELLDAGTVVEVAGRRTPAGPAGRRPWSACKGTLGVAVGIEIANGVVRAAVCNTAQELLLHDAVPMDDHTPPESTLKTAGALVDHMLARRASPAPRSSASAIAMPGPIQRRSGVNGRATTLKPWVNVNPRTAAAEASCGLPLLVDNDANLAALAEITWGAARGLQGRRVHLLGLGHRRRLRPQWRAVPRRERHGRRARPHHDRRERPRVRVRRPRLPQHPGQRGRHHPEPVAQPPRPALHRRRDQAGPDGDAGCRRVLADAGRHIGLAAANMYNLLDPELIVLGGNLAPAGEILLGPLRESMARRAIHAGEVLPPVVVGALDEKVVVLGAAAAVLRDRRTLPSAPAERVR